MEFLQEKTKLIGILNKWNVWEGKKYDTGVPRDDYIKMIDKFIKVGKVVSITGVRRSGKSTIMKQYVANLLKQGIKSQNILFVNLEESEFGKPTLELLLKIYEAYREILQPDGKPFIFLDEIQNVPKWEKFVRSLNERKDANIIVSGSNAKLLSSEYSTVLTGRQLLINVFPFSFREFLIFNKILYFDDKTMALKGEKIRTLYRTYLNYGGFPEILLFDDINLKNTILNSYVSDIIHKDIISRYNIRKIQELQTLMRYYVQNYSNQITYNRIGNFIDLDTKTISEYSHYLKETNLIFFIKKFIYSIKHQEKSSKKVYLIDIGLDVLNNLGAVQNIGRKIENLVAIKLKSLELLNPLKKIYFWKDQYNKKEVDFVIQDRNTINQIIQVCWDISNPKTLKREKDALLLAGKIFNLKEGIIITEDVERMEQLDNFVIKYIPLWKWLIDK